MQWKYKREGYTPGNALEHFSQIRSTRRYFKLVYCLEIWNVLSIKAGVQTTAIHDFGLNAEAGQHGFTKAADFEWALKIVLSTFQNKQQYWKQAELLFIKGRRLRMGALRQLKSKLLLQLDEKSRKTNIGDHSSCIRFGQENTKISPSETFFCSPAFGSLENVHWSLN